MACLVSEDHLRSQKTRCTLCRHETESWHATVFSECSASDTSGPSNGTWHWHCQSRGLIHYAWPSKCWQKMLFDSLLTHCCEAWKLWVFHLKTEKSQWSSIKMHCSQFETADDLCFLCKCQICAERTVQVVRITSRKSSCTESCLDMTEKMTLNGRLVKFKSRKAVNPCSASSVFNAHSTKNLTDRLSVTWIFRVKNIKITANSTESHLRLKKTSGYFPQ